MPGTPSRKHLPGWEVIMIVLLSSVVMGFWKPHSASTSWIFISMWSSSCRLGQNQTNSQRGRSKKRSYPASQLGKDNKSAVLIDRGTILDIDAAIRAMLLMLRDTADQAQLTTRQKCFLSKKKNMVRFTCIQFHTPLFPSSRDKFSLSLLNTATGTTDHLLYRRQTL